MIDLTAKSLSEVPLIDSQTRHLNLSRNKLILFTLEFFHLKYLNLHKNELSLFFIATPVPTHLASLDLSSNRLSRLPPELAEITSLTELYLSDNRFTIITFSFERLTNLHTLSLSKNKLTNLPLTLQHCPLTHFGASFNLLSEFPHFLKNIDSLRSIHLEGNPFEKKEG
jgi:Leucine-rich repeat (LRR) protein